MEKKRGKTKLEELMFEETLDAEKDKKEQEVIFLAHLDDFAAQKKAEASEKVRREETLQVERFHQKESGLTYEEIKTERKKTQEKNRGGNEQNNLAEMEQRARRREILKKKWEEIAEKSNTSKDAPQQQQRRASSAQQQDGISLSINTFYL